jgi:hypothetical protein
MTILGKVMKWLSGSASSDDPAPAIPAPAPVQGEKLADSGHGSNPYAELFNQHGVLKSTKDIPDSRRIDYALYIPYRERAEIALHVAHFWRGGDYFEFGSDGMATFRNLLTGFDLNGMQAKYPDTRFYAFDIFGECSESIAQKERSERAYFESYADIPGVNKYQQALSTIRDHGLFLDRCVLRKGLFEDTLNQEFKDGYKAERRSISFAFLDCNILSSYRTCFDFIIDFVRPGTFVYMDEYYVTQGVPALFDRFCDRLKAEMGDVRPLFVRNAGTFGALFLLAAK